MIIPSLACPGACHYCFGPREGEIMDSSTGSAAISFMDRIMRETNQDKLRLTFHGGEPLVAGYSFFENFLGEIDSVFSGRRRDLALQSNFWLLDERFCDLLKRYQVYVGTSLDGPEEINDSQRGAGSFARTMVGIERARAANISVSCIATFTGQSTDHWEEVFDFFRLQNLPFSLHAAVPSLHGKSGLEIDPALWGDILRGMLARYTRERHHIRIETLDQLCRTAVEGEGAVCALRDCFGMFLVIDPSGGIYPCQRMAGLERFRLGSIFDNPSMMDLAASKPARLFLEREVRIRDVCGSCEHFGLCKGGCAYNALAHGGDKDPLCTVWKSVFDEIQERLAAEMETPENITLLAERGLRRNGHPLIHTGAIAELGRRHGHPFQTVRNARRIVAAMELARSSDINHISRRLVEMGISSTFETAKSALIRMKNSLAVTGKLNKLYLHVTFRCQLHCTHCYAQAGDEHADYEMLPDDLARLAVEGAASGFQEIVITGGEPLIHRERQRVLERLKGVRTMLKDTKLVLRTNFALPLSGTDMDQIGAAFDQVVASIDGPPELHDARRGAGSFARLQQNLVSWMSHCVGRNRRIAEVPRAELTLAASLRSNDARGAVGRSIWDLADRLGIRHVKMRPLLPLGRARDWNEPPTTEVLHMNIQPWEVLEQGFYPCASCGIGQNLYVEPDGTAFPCYAYHRPHSVLGNVCRDGLAAVLDNPEFRNLASRTVDTNRRCRSCDMRYICGGSCRVWSGEATQYDLDAPPRNCDPLRKRAERIYQEALAYLGLEAD